MFPVTALAASFILAFATTAPDTWLQASLDVRWHINIFLAIALGAFLGGVLALVDHYFDGYMYLILPLLLAGSYYLSKAPESGTSPKPDNADDNRFRIPVRFAKSLIRPALVAFAAFGSFIQVFGYFRVG